MDPCPLITMDRILALLITGALLVSCTPNNGDLENAKNGRYVNTLYSYSLNVPYDIISTNPSQTGSSVGFINYDHWKNNPPKNGYYLFIKTESACPPLGVTEPKAMNASAGKAWWGRSDFFEKYRTHDVRDEDRSICNPPSPIGVTRKYVECEETDFDTNDCGRKNRQYEIDHGMYSAYAFCADKNGKAVTICIQQMTDDEEMAKQIFESFRWTD